MAKLKARDPYDDAFFAEPHTPAASAAPELGTLAPPSTPVPGPDAEVPARPVMVRVNFELHASLHRQLKQLALDEDTTVADIVRGLIRKRVNDAKSPSAG